MTISLLVVDDEPDVPSLFRQRFWREARADAHVLHFAHFGAASLDRLAGIIQPSRS